MLNKNNLVVIDDFSHDVVVHNFNKHVTNVKNPNNKNFLVNNSAPNPVKHLTCNNCNSATIKKSSKINSKDLVLADSGNSTPLLIREESIKHLENLTGTGGYCVEVANGDNICSYNKGDFRISPNCVITGHVFRDNLLSNNLLGLAPFVNNDYDLELAKTYMNISKNGIDIIHASKYPDENLWRVNLANLLEYDSFSPLHQHRYADIAPLTKQHVQQGFAHLAIHSTSAAEQVLWMSECMGSLPDVTIIRALRDGLFNFHGVTHEMYAKNRPSSIITSLGHMKANRQGIQSTKLPVRQRNSPKSTPSSSTKDEEELDLDFMSPDLIGDDDEAYISVVSLDKVAPRPDHNAMAQADASGRVPVKSISGNNYILITVFRNYIKFNAFSDRSAASYSKF